MYPVLVELYTLLHTLPLWHRPNQGKVFEKKRSLQGGSVLKNPVHSWREGKSFTKVHSHTHSASNQLFEREMRLKKPQHGCYNL